MALTIEWRTKGELDDAVLILDDNGAVLEALSANQALLSRYLAQQVGDLGTWRGDRSVDGDDRHPEAWGDLVLARASDGELIDVEPELLWQGIYLWFRSHGVDYDTPGLQDKLLGDDRGEVKLRRSQLMDD